MAKISIYLNNFSSKSNSEYWKKKIGDSLFRHTLKFREPMNLKELENFLKKERNLETEYIFSVGGDGTVNKIIPYLIDGPIKLLVIPAGTANDFASELGFDQKFSKALKIFQSKNIEHLDVIKINDEYMVTNGGLGLPSAVASSVNNLRKKFWLFQNAMKKVGDPVYVLMVMKEILAKKEHLKFQIEGVKELKGKVFEGPMILVNNQERIAGKFSVAPSTQNNDGKFNLSIFTHQSKLSLAKCVKSLFKGEEFEDENLLSFECKKIKIKILNENKALFFGDGEILDESNTFEISILPKALHVCSAKNYFCVDSTYSLDGISKL